MIRGDHEPKPTENMSRTKAIEAARSNVTELYRFGGNWRFNHYDSSVDAWRESNPTTYYAARAQRAKTLIGFAVLEMTGDEHRADSLAMSYNGGPWTDYV